MPIHQALTLTLTTAAILTTPATPTATATTPTTPANGQVVAFIGDFLPTKTWENPTGCHPLPPATHVIFNETNRTIEVFADPMCLIPLEPLTRLPPARSTHVSSVGSFRA